MQPGSGIFDANVPLLFLSAKDQIELCFLFVG
jgi:hypothetical protein